MSIIQQKVINTSQSGRRDRIGLGITTLLHGRINQRKFSISLGMDHMISKKSDLKSANIPKNAHLTHLSLGILPMN